MCGFPRSTWALAFHDATQSSAVPPREDYWALGPMPWALTSTQCDLRMSALRISTDPAAFDRDLIHRYLHDHSYWARGIPRDVVERAIDHSLCFGGFVDARQVAFARMVTDRATFAYLADVFVLPECRGRGYGKQLVAAVLAHPDLLGLRRIMLATRDAHGLYAAFGFAPPAMPETLMERRDPDVYLRAAPMAPTAGEGRR